MVSVHAWSNLILDQILCFNLLSKQPIDTIIFISVFPKDFSNLEISENLAKEKTETVNALSKSNTSFSHTITIHLTENECKLYCASDKHCCGCMKFCNETCRWNNVMDCELMRESNPAVKTILSKKPGKSIAWHFYTIFYTVKSLSTILST